MPFYTLYANKDAYVSYKKKNNNYGVDPVLTLSFSSSSSAVQDFTRILMRFNTDVLASVTGSYTATMVLYNCDNGEFTDENYTVDIFPITQDWNQGKFSYMYPGSGSVSYLYRTESQLWSSSGVTYSASPSASFTFTAGTENLTANMSAFVEYWRTNPNYGVLIKFNEQYESATSASAYENVKTFFGNNTHTFYKPRINITVPETLITDDIHNLKYGANRIFVYDRTVASSAYPGMVYLSTDLTVATTASPWSQYTPTYFAPYTWYITYNNAQLAYANGLWLVQSNTAASFSVTSSVTGNLLMTSNRIYTSVPNVNAPVNEVYSVQDVAILRAKPHLYVHRSSGSVVVNTYPASGVFMSIRERNTGTEVMSDQQMHYDKDGYFYKVSMSNFQPNFYYYPVVKTIDELGTVMRKELKESVFFVKE